MRRVLQRRYTYSDDEMDIIYKDDDKVRAHFEESAATLGLEALDEKNKDAETWDSIDEYKVS